MLTPHQIEIEMENTMIAKETSSANYGISIFHIYVNLLKGKFHQMPLCQSPVSKIMSTIQLSINWGLFNLWELQESSGP